MTARVRTILLLSISLLLGVELWLTLGRGLVSRDFHPFALAVGVIVIGTCVRIGPHWPVFVQTLRAWFHWHSGLVAVLVGAVASAYLGTVAFLSGRQIGLFWADDFSYQLQVKMLSTGRLWTSAHPLADFFESPQLLVKPVYASMYFPGAAMLYVPSAWLNLPTWVLPVLAAGATVGLSYAIVARSFGPMAGGLTALLLVGTGAFRTESTVLASRVPMMLFGLIAIFAFVRWYEGRGLKWAALAGAMMGWAAITRPLDAVCVALPLMVATAYRLRAHRPPGCRADCVKMIAIAALAAGPFLAVQLVFNKGVTGEWLRTPFRAYADQDLPGTTLGFRPADFKAEPTTALPYKRELYQGIATHIIAPHRPERVFKTWTNDRLQTTVDATIAHPLLVVLVPVGVVGWVFGRSDGRRRIGAKMLVGIVPCFVIGYAFYAYFLPSYPILIAPAVAMLIAIAPRALATLAPQVGRYLRPMAVGAIVLLAVLQLPEFNRFVFDQRSPSPWETKRQQVAALPAPAIVLFDVDGKLADGLMPVYNESVVNPDDAPIIQANDLGKRNIELFTYYAKRQPERSVFRYRMSDTAPVYLGKVADLATNRVPSTGH